MTRRMAYVLLALATTVFPARLDAAEPQILSMAPRKLPTELATLLKGSELVLADSNVARELIAGTINAGSEKLNLDDPNFYCAIHLVQWGEVTTNGVSKPVVTSQRWYLYRGGSKNFIRVGFSDRTRLFSDERFYVLGVDLSFKEEVGDRNYKVEVKAKPATNVAHLSELLKEFTLTARDAGAVDRFGYAQVDMGGAQAADVSITPQIRKDKKDTAIGDPKGYNYEPLQWWDVGIGVPIRRASEVSLDSDTQTVSPKDIDRNTILVLFSVYAQPIDLQSTGLRTVPHLVVGLDATEKFDPRKRFFIGGGWGPALANVYVGGELVKLDQPSPSGKTREWQLAFGISFSGLGTLKKATK